MPSKKTEKHRAKHEKKAGRPKEKHGKQKHKKQAADAELVIYQQLFRTASEDTQPARQPSHLFTFRGEGYARPPLCKA